MTSLEILERKIAGLSLPELAEFRGWCMEFDVHRGERQIEEDAESGRLDALAEAALTSLEEGKPIPLRPLGSILSRAGRIDRGR